LLAAMSWNTGANKQEVLNIK